MAKVGVANSSIDKLDAADSADSDDRLVISQGAPEIPEKRITVTILNKGLDHGGLQGLEDDDHPIYAHLDGSKPFTGNVTMEGDLEVGGLFNSQGGRQLKITAIVDATYSVLKSDVMVFVNTTTNGITLTLPAIVTGSTDDGRVFRIQKAIDSSNSLTITAQAPSKINSEETDIILGLKNDSITTMAYQGNWYLINRDSSAFGALELAAPGALQLLGGTFSKLLIYDTNRFTTPGVNVADHTNDVISVAHVESVTLGGDGYRLSFRIEITGFTNNQEIAAEIFVDGVATNIQAVLPTRANFNTILEAEGLYQIPNSPQDVEVRIAASTVETAEFVTAQLITERLAK